MRTLDAFAIALAGVLMIVAALVWLFGPYGLLGSGIVLAAFALVVVDLKPDREQEQEEQPLL